MPRARSLRYHPLAVQVAHDLGDELAERNLLRELLQQWATKWELPPIERMMDNDTLVGTVNQAIVEGQLKQVVEWLKARIAGNRTWAPNYVELARVLENQTDPPDIDGAFDILSK